jgi:hypothetical protein
MVGIFQINLVNGYVFGSFITNQFDYGLWTIGHGLFKLSFR